MYNTIELM